MARSLAFNNDPDSCSDRAGSHLLDRVVVPYHVWFQEFKKEKKKNSQTDWCHFIGFFEDRPNRDDWRQYRHLHDMRKPLVMWVLEFMQRVEIRLQRDFDDWSLLSWTFSYYLHRSETEEAIRYSVPMWFVKVTDPEGQCVHHNWTVAFDNEGDLRIKRGVATNEDPMGVNSFWFRDNAEGRLIDAMYAHMRLRELKIKRMK